MSGGLLIGFDYDNTRDDFLIGTISDLRMAYEFSLNSNLDSYLLITDIDFSDEGVSYSPNDFIFLKKAINSNKLTISNPNTEEEFFNTINNFLSNLHTVMIYYTGHADKIGIMLSLNTKKLITKITNYDALLKKTSNIKKTSKKTNLGIPENMFSYEDITNIIPETLFSQINNEAVIHDNINMIIIDKSKNNNIIIPFKSIQSILYNKTDKKAQILYIMDCCHGDLGLPFVLNRDTGIYGFKTNKDIIIPTQKIICISSSLKSQNSLSNIEGSLFTKEFFSIFHNIIYYIDLIREIGHDKLNSYSQTLNIHSSRPNIKSPWHWCFGPSKMHIEYVGDLITILKL